MKVIVVLHEMISSEGIIMHVRTNLLDCCPLCGPLCNICALEHCLSLSATQIGPVHALGVGWGRVV